MMASEMSYFTAHIMYIEEVSVRFSIKDAFEGAHKEACNKKTALHVDETFVQCHSQCEESETLFSSSLPLFGLCEKRAFLTVSLRKALP